MEPLPASPSFSTARRTGRLAKFIITTALEYAITIFLVHGWNTGYEDASASTHANVFFSCVYEEIMLSRDRCCAMMGNIKCLPDDLPMLELIRDKSAYVDCGSDTRLCLMDLHLHASHTINLKALVEMSSFFSLVCTHR